MSFKSENDVTESLDSDQAQTLPATSETVNAEQQTVKKSLFGKAVRIKGDISAREDLVINGRVDGTIALKMNKLEIGEGGHVQANVFAKMVVVSGEVFGDLYASDQVIVTKTGRVLGDIYTADVSIEDGAHIKGNIDMQKQDVFKQHIGSDMQDEHHEKNSGFGFLFRKNREASHTDTMLLPDLRENTEIAEELTSLPVDDININPGTNAECSIIGDTVVIKGELTAEEDVIIQGHLEGVVYFKNSSLGVGAHAEIKGNIFVKSMVHHGKSYGDIYASDQVSIKKPGHVFGKILAPRVSTEKGAVIMGSIEMEPQNIEEIYDKFHGAAEATLIAEDNTKNHVVTSVDDEESGRDSGSGQGRNTAWPIFYPRT